MPGDTDGSTWRFIPVAANDAAMNMALDEAVFLGNLEGSSPPTLRPYLWSGPSVTLGRRVKPASIDSARSSGAAIVRRPTGGGAVCHGSSLTLSIAGGVLSLLAWGAREGIPASSIRRSGVRHRALNSAVWAALCAAGVDCSLVPPSESWGRGTWCFSIPCAHDIVSAGRKIYGSAQLVSGGTFLYQGNLMTDAGFDTDTFCRHLRRALGERLGWELAPGELTAAERRRAERLRRDKYERPEWNLHARGRLPAAVCSA